MFKEVMCARNFIVSELQPLGWGHKRREDGAVGPRDYGCINSVGADKRYCRCD